MKEDYVRAVSDFVVGKMDKSLTSGLLALARLRMPIHDKRALEAQLAAMTAKADEGDKQSLDQVGKAMVASDFPILSIESAFEKYWDKVFPPPTFIRGPDVLFDIPPASQELPSVCEIFRQTFSRAPAECACRAYAEALREGLNENQAIIVGHFAGRRVAGGGACPV